MAMGNRMKKVGFAALAMATVLMVASPALAASSITVQGVSSSGSMVTVTVRNSSCMLSLGTVRAEATVNGTRMTTSASVLLLPGQTATVSMRFDGIVGQILSVGISEDDHPI